MPIKNANEAAAIESWFNEEAEDCRGQNLRSQEQEQEQKCLEVCLVPQAICASVDPKSILCEFFKVGAVCQGLQMQVLAWFECLEERGEDLKVLASFGFDGFFLSNLQKQKRIRIRRPWRKWWSWRKSSIIKINQLTL